MVFGIDLTIGGAGFIVVTFIIGLLLGVVVKRVFKLAIAVVALIAILILTGYVNLNQDQVRKETIFHAYSTISPSLISTVSQVATLLPLTSAAFLAGVGLGLWKG